MPDTARHDSPDCAPDIVVVGSINADLTVRVARHPLPGETLLGSGGTITPGGKGANQALAAARLGSRVAVIGAVGSDEYAGAATSLLRDGAVDLTRVARIHGTTGLAIITVAEDGENTVMVIPGANGMVGHADVDKHADFLNRAPLVLLQGELPPDAFGAAARHAGGRVVINLAPVIAVERDALLCADPLVVNEHEAGLVIEQLGGSANLSAPEDQLAALLRAGFTSVVITLGAAGALVGETGKDTPILVDSPRVRAVDSVGAGDAFTGALCHELVRGTTLVEATAVACRVGAFSVTRNGAQPSYPHAADELPV